MERAGNWKEFLAAVSEFDSPQQNIVYADVDGHIGFIAAGRVPIRRPDNDLKGLAPAPGWEAKYDWAGFIPFDQLPRVYDTADGEIYTANNKITPPGYTHFITSEWQPPYRARRIAELLDAVPKHTISSFARMQGDVVSLAARQLLPRLIATHPKSEQARHALALLARWDGSMSVERPEPLIFMAWWRELARAIYADELGEAFSAHWLPRPVFLNDVLSDRDGEARWCDNVRTRPVETCAEQLSTSLEAALADLRARYGKDMTRWRWGAAHRALGEHRPFARNKWLARFFDIRVPTPGGDYTLDRGVVDFASPEPFANRRAPSLRAIYDLSDLQNSLFIDSTGQSGNVLSPHYRDFVAAWAQGEYIPMISDRARLEAAHPQRLVLQPAP
jgi:penicillin G amidase